MGLLDGQLDPQTMASLQLAGGLLSPGSFGQGLQRGISGYQNTLTAAQEMQLRQQQIQTSQQEQQQRDLAIRRTTAQLAEADRWNTPDSQVPGSPPQPNAVSQSGGLRLTGDQPPSGQLPLSGGVNSAGPASFQPTQGTTLSDTPDGAPTGLPRGVVGYRGMPLEQLRSRINAGLEPKEAVDLWKAANVGTPMAPGWRITGNQQPQYLSDPNQQFTFASDNKTVIPQPGSLSAKSQAVTATTSAEMRAKNAATPLPPELVDRLGPQWAGKSVQDYMDANGSAQATPTPNSFQGSDALAKISPTDRTRILSARAASGELAQPFTLTANTSAGQLRGAMVNPGAANPVQSSATVNAPATGFKTSADIEAEKLRAAQPVNFQTKRLNEYDTQNSATFDKLNDTLRNEAELQNRNAQLLPMLDKFQTGGFAPEERIALGNALKTSGMVPESIRNSALPAWIAGGDPATGKVIENQLASAGIKTMLDTLDKEGKPNRAIFQAIQAAQESVKSGNATLKQVFGLQKQLYDWHLDQQQKMSAALASPDYNPLTFQAQFAKSRDTGLQEAQATAIPENLSAANLKVGTVYKLPNGTLGKWDGFKFRGQ